MSEQKEQKPKIAIFANKQAGQPITKKDGSEVVGSDGKLFLHAHSTGKISLPGGLPAGEYEVAIYKTVAKSGLDYLVGTIKPAWKKVAVEVATVKAADAAEFDDTIPF